jgi:hypothetical protein
MQAKHATKTSRFLLLGPKNSLGKVESSTLKV